MSRLKITRYHPGVATPAVLRRRGLRVLGVGRWLLIYTPRKHWSNDL